MQTSLLPIPLIPQPTFKPPSKLLAALPPAQLRASRPRPVQRLRHPLLAKV
jgi:hypothetical protein